MEFALGVQTESMNSKPDWQKQTVRRETFLLETWPQRPVTALRH